MTANPIFVPQLHPNDALGYAFQQTVESVSRAKAFGPFEAANPHIYEAEQWATIVLALKAVIR